LRGQDLNLRPSGQARRRGGVDISEKMLATARRKARRAGLDIAFHHADAAQLPFTIGRASLHSHSLA
jgi:ubiquinone/menaquinone biosynthesis C-methylase UbiE